MQASDAFELVEPPPISQRRRWLHGVMRVLSFNFIPFGRSTVVREKSTGREVGYVGRGTGIEVEQVRADLESMTAQEFAGRYASRWMTGG